MVVGGYSSVVEHSTADREVPGSNPGVPCVFIAYISDDSKSFNLKHLMALLRWPSG